MIIRADARSIPLRDGCVQVCVTSPPYWGLRDYQTGRWDGGDADCDHVARVMKPSAKSTLEDHGDDGRSPYLDSLRGIPYRDLCGKCGALRIDRQIGLEATPELFVATMVEVFREVRRVLRDDGTVWLNLGDSYAAGKIGRTDYEDFPRPRGGHREGSGPQTGVSRCAPDGLKPKDLCGIPWRVAFALQADGWYLRSDIVWAKPNPMPESVTDRPTRSHEYIFLLTKKPTYYFDAEAIREPAEFGFSPTTNGKFAASIGGQHATHTVTRGDGTGGRNKRDVWTVNSEPLRGEAHFATFPQKLVEPCILAGTSEKGCCTACSAPWVRVIGRTGVDNSTNEVIADYDVPGLSKGSSADRIRRLSGATYQRVVSATGQWRPSCRCKGFDFGEPLVKPCLVLDPFAGSGTVMKVAERFGRRSVGLELSTDYIQIAQRRTSQMGLRL